MSQHMCSRRGITFEKLNIFKDRFEIIFSDSSIIYLMAICQTLLKCVVSAGELSKTYEYACISDKDMQTGLNIHSDHKLMEMFIVSNVCEISGLIELFWDVSTNYNIDALKRTNCQNLSSGNKTLSDSGRIYLACIVDDYVDKITNVVGNKSHIIELEETKKIVDKMFSIHITKMDYNTVPCVFTAKQYAERCMKPFIRKMKKKPQDKTQKVKEMENFVEI